MFTNCRTWDVRCWFVLTFLIFCPIGVKGFKWKCSWVDGNFNWRMGLSLIFSREKSLGKSENISSKAHCRMLSVFTRQTVQPLLFAELSESFGKDNYYVLTFLLLSVSLFSDAKMSTSAWTQLVNGLVLKSA